MIIIIVVFILRFIKYILSFSYVLINPVYDGRAIFYFIKVIKKINADCKWPPVNDAAF